MLKSNLRSKTSKSFTQRPKIRNQSFKIDPPGLPSSSQLLFLSMFSLDYRGVDTLTKVYQEVATIMLRRPSHVFLTLGQHILVSGCL